MLKLKMEKFTFFDQNKSIILHNLVPKIKIRIIEFDSKNEHLRDELEFEIIIKEKLFYFVLDDVNFNIEDYKPEYIISILKRAGKWYKSRIILGQIDLK